MQCIPSLCWSRSCWLVRSRNCSLVALNAPVYGEESSLLVRQRADRARVFEQFQELSFVGRIFHVWIIYCYTKLVSQGKWDVIEKDLTMVISEHISDSIILGIPMNTNFDKNVSNIQTTSYSISRNSDISIEQGKIINL